MNIEDRDARRRGRAVDDRLPLTDGGKEVTGWLEIGAGSRSNGCRACKHQPVMTGQTEICITLGEARFASFSATLGKSVPRSLSNRRTFSA